MRSIVSGLWSEKLPHEGNNRLKQKTTDKGVLKTGAHIGLK